MRHSEPHLRKLFDTLRLCAGLLMARTFGKYRESGWNGDYDYAHYVWRGRDYWLQTRWDSAVDGQTRWGVYEKWIDCPTCGGHGVLLQDPFEDVPVMEVK